MSTGVDTRTVEAALDEIASWRAEQEGKKQKELAEVEQELGTLRTALESLQQQLEALETFKAQLTDGEGDIELQEIERAYASIFDALASQATRVAQRATLVAEAEQARTDATLESLARSDSAPLFEEYRQFRTTVQPTLAALPESYRSVVTQHHEQLAAKLRETVGRLLAGPVTLDAEPLEVEVVYGIDAPEDAPELLIVVLPVADEVHGRWVSRDEDLQTWVAARVVQAIYQAVREAGPAGAQALCGGHKGLLAIEADLVGAKGDIGAVVQRQLEAVLGSAPELVAAGLKVTVREVSVDYLLPPEEEEPVTVTEAAHA